MSQVDTSLSGSVITINAKQINLGVNFENGLADPEINKKTGDVIALITDPKFKKH